MTSNAISCSRWRLYVIVDVDAARGRDVVSIAEGAIRGGADVLQLRDKTSPTRAVLERAAALRRLTRAAGVALIINDRADVALAVGADGVHVGQDDLPVPLAKRLLGPGRLVGTSTHSLEQALEADRQGADYIAVGPLYPTPTKPGSLPVGLPLVGWVKAQVHQPIVCIGGVDAATLSDVLAAGAPCVAVVRAVCAAEDPARAAGELKRRLTQFFHEAPPCGL